MLQTSPSESSVELVRDTTAALFVINLCASTTPVALAHPASAELKRFTFFVTRRREEGRERFRLHMGYFDNLADAEAMLGAIRDVYPAAWAGPAPENRAPSARATTRPAIAAVKTPAVAAVPEAAPPQAPVAPIARVAAVTSVAQVAPVVPVAAPVPAVPVAVVTPVSVAAPPAVPLAALPPVAAPAAPEAAALAPPAAQFELETMSNVREVIAQLADDPPPAKAAAKPAAALPPQPTAAPKAAAPTVAASKPVAAKTVAAPVVAVKPVPVAVKPAARVLAVAPPQAPVAKSEIPTINAAPPQAPVAKSEVPTIKEAPPLTASQTLKVLESLPDAASASTVNKIRVLTPEDTQTLRDIKLEAQRNAPSSYAVQLVWAVQPIDMNALPHLAIFDAYTLYHVEGNRQGRRWYGLRLGFFTDSGAAKQVAHYVRSEYASVAVVPVTAKEKDGARAPTLSAAPAPQVAPPPRPDLAKIPTVKALDKSVRSGATIDGFELLPDDAPAAAKRDLDDPAAAVEGPQTSHPVLKPATKTPLKKPTGKRVVVRKPSPPGAPQPLESTLEILGASTLTIDESREVINDSAIRKARPPKKEKAGRFARLLSRLSDKHEG